jgi:hypothetical protein
MENILKLFNSQDEAELKQAFKEIIKTQFKNELNDMNCYLFDANVIEELIEETFKEVIQEVSLELKDTLKEKLLKNLDIDKLVNQIVK